MAIEFTEENFNILFNEEKALVEIIYQGVNAEQLANLLGRVNSLEDALSAALSGANGQIGTISIELNSLSTLVNALSSAVSDEIALRSYGDELNSSQQIASNNELLARIADEVNARGAAILAEAAERGAAIASATGTIVTDVAALTTTVQGQATRIGAAEASILNIAETLSTETEARALQYSALQVDFGNTNAAVLDETLARVRADEALISRIESISAGTGTNIFIQPEPPVSGMVAGDLWYDSDDGNRPYRYTGVEWVDVSDLRITNNTAAIINEAAIRLEGDQLNASNILTVQGTLSTEILNRQAADGLLEDRLELVEGSVTQEAFFREQGDLTSAGLINSVDLRVTTETNQRTAADELLQSNIDTVVGQVVEEATVRFNSDQTISSRYGVKVNANGHVAGFGLIATNNNFGNAGDSEFVVDATRFKVFNGASSVAPFVVSGGVVYMQNVVVTNAQILALEMGKITAGSINAPLTASNAGSIRFGKAGYGVGTGIYLGYNGSYVLDIGTPSAYLRWTGTALELGGADITLDGGAGFVRRLGTNVASTYIDWYGTGPITDENATFYIKKSGSSYFGGDIRTSFAPRAWARFYRTTSNTIYFTRQLGFSSASFLGNGRYRFNFTTPQPNRFYAVFAMAANENDIDKGLICSAYDVSTTGFSLALINAGGNYRNTNLGQLIVFGSNEVVTEPPPGYDYETDPNPPIWGGLIP